VTLRRAARGLALAQLGVLALAAVLGRWLAAGSDVAELQRRLPQASAGELLAWWALATQYTAGVVLGATLVAAALGVLLGAASVYGESGAGALALRLVEFLGAVPALILAGVLRLADPSGGALGLFISLALLRTLEVAQLVRAHVLLIIPSDFVEASRALGASRRWQLRTHVLPRLSQPLAVNLLLGAASLVGLEAALGFVGLGLPSESPSWGGGLAALSQGGAAVARGVLPAVCVVASIGSTCAALYGLAISLERRQRRAPGFGPRQAETLRELGAERRGS
jgi:ABC-type dipeptide/oligopeptide/nickel transport system permease subunit